MTETVKLFDVECPWGEVRDPNTLDCSKCSDLCHPDNRTRESAYCYSCDGKKFAIADIYKGQLTQYVRNSPLFTCRVTVYDDDSSVDGCFCWLFKSVE